MLTPWKKSHDQPKQHIKKQRHYFANKSPSSQGYGFSSGHVWMWDLDCDQSWVLKNWCFWTVLLVQTLESPLDCKEIQPVHPKGDQSWVFIGRTDVEAETPILWPPGAKNWLIWKDSCWERLKAGGEGDDREWDGWMASPSQWTWVWVNSRSWWSTGEPVLTMGSQRVGHDWVTELKWLNRSLPIFFSILLHQMCFLNGLIRVYHFFSAFEWVRYELLPHHCNLNIWTSYFEKLF